MSTLHALCRQTNLVELEAALSKAFSTTFNNPLQKEMAICEKLYQECYRNYEEQIKVMKLFFESEEHLHKNALFQDTFKQFKKLQIKALNAEAANLRSLERQRINILKRSRKSYTTRNGNP